MLFKKKLHNDGWYGTQKSTLEERFYLCSFPVGEKGDTMNEEKKWDEKGNMDINVKDSSLLRISVPGGQRPQQ